MIPEFGLLQNRWHWETDRAAAINHGIIAVRNQSHKRWFAVTEFIRKEVFLHLQAGGLAGNDLLTQSDDRLWSRSHVQDGFAVLLVEFSNVLVDSLEMHLVPLSQLLAGDGVVIDFGRLLRGWLIDVPPQPNGLNDDANVLVILQSERCKLLDARIGQEDRRQRQHIHHAGLERVLGLVLVRNNVPMLNDA